MLSALKSIRTDAIVRNLKKSVGISFTDRSFALDSQSKLWRAARNRQVNYPQRYLTNKRGSANKTDILPWVIGGALATGVGGYIYSTFKSKPDTELIDLQQDEFDVPFVHETLEQDLKLLNEFGPIPYLLIGAGNASFAAFRAIRVNDPTARVLMIGDEPFYPYMRPPLSKEMWFERSGDVAQSLSFTQWSGKQRSIFYEPDEYYFSVKEMLEHKNGGVSVIRGKKVVKIDPVSHSVFLDTGEEIKYQKCLLAPGAKPKNLPVFEQADSSVKKHVSLFRTARDFQRLDKIAKNSQSVVIVGGGFLGSELAYGLAKRGSETGLKVTQIFPESGNLALVLPEYLSKWVSDKVESTGVAIKPNVTVKSVTKKGDKVELHLSNDEVVTADHVVVAVGVEPDTKLAKTSGLEVDEKHGGFLVNTEMEARRDLWIAGDASCFYDPLLGRRRVEHHDHAVVSGRLAGENMTGKGQPYEHQSMIWSDLGPEIGFEAVGLVDSTLPTVGVFTKGSEKKEDAPTNGDKDSNAPESESTVKKEEQTQEDHSVSKPVDDYSKGVIFYLKNDIIVGILMWNVFTKMSVARKIISESKSYDDLVEVAKLFDLYSVEE